MAQMRALFRLTKRRALILGLLPFVGLGAGNLFFVTPWGTGMVEGVLEKRINLPCKIDRAGWTPWGGAVLKGLSVTLPQEVSEGVEPILSVRSIRVDPSWSSLLGGKKRFERMEIDGVRLDVRLEDLKTLMATRKNEEVKVEVVEPVAEVAGPGGDEVETPPESGDPTGGAPSSEGGEAGEVAGGEVAGSMPVAPVDDFEGLLLFHDVSIRISSSAAPKLAVELEEISGEIPLWGREREGAVSFGKLKLGDDGFEDHLELPVRWRDGYLEIREPEVQVVGVRLEIEATCKLEYGLPYGVQVKLPKQPINFTSMRKNAPPVDFTELSSLNVVQGYLMKPGLIYGTSETTMTGCVIKDPKDGSEMVFLRGGARFELSTAGLSAPELYLVGEEEAFLGNGFLTSGGGAATVRVIGNPQRAESYEKRVRAADPEWTLNLQPLVTRDRWYRDLRIELGEAGASIDLGKGGREVPLMDVINQVKGGGRSAEPAMVP
ncbi:MAG: hypothetical protein ACSHYF_18195 [Verrucomicrobiaceae bacterium]